MQGGERAGLTMRWGPIPFFAKGEPPNYSTINATVEKLEIGAAWRGPRSRGQRCIMPAAAFYEWHMEHGKKNPFLIKLADQELFGFAALWDRSFKPDGAAIESCALITLPGNELMRASTTPVHIRSACRHFWRQKIANDGSPVPRSTRKWS
jgi:putative SOS response-associated peptidase YedK